MDLSLNADQKALLAGLERLIEPFKEVPADFGAFVLEGQELEAQLCEAGFFEIADTPGLGPLAAALVVERLARLPRCAEFALSMLVGPRLGPKGWPRPFALVEEGRPARFLGRAKTLIVAQDSRLGLTPVPSDGVQAVESIYAYPMARLTREAPSEPVTGAEASELRLWLRVALATEAAGLMQAGIDATVEHLTIRTQFGRPLGTFQALRHRLSECAVLAGGVKWLALKAASTCEEGDAAQAAFHAQHSASRIVYDLHQMLGAMGMTLEHPLHLWTYRLRALQSELGGQSAQAQAVGRLCFS